MGIFVSWLDANWFNFLQTAGIVAGLFFSGYAALRENRSRKIENLLSIHESHRTIWLQVFDDPHLLRVLKSNVRLNKRPVTMQERIFVNLIILHLTSVLTAMRAGVMEKPAGFDVDLRELFSLPIPRQVWLDTLKYRDDDTRHYVENIAGLKAHRRPRNRYWPVIRLGSHTRRLLTSRASPVRIRRPIRDE